MWVLQLCMYVCLQEQEHTAEEHAPLTKLLERLKQRLPCLLEEQMALMKQSYPAVVG